MAQPHRNDQPHMASQTREAVGVFSSADVLDRAVEDLLGSGFEQADISLIASDDTVESKLGHRLARSADAEDDPNVPRRGWTPPQARTEGKAALSGILGYFGAVALAGVTFATGGGALAAIALGVLGGSASAAAGARLANAIDQSWAQSLQTQIAHGGILVWVRVDDEAQSERAMEILRRHGAGDVHTHVIRHR
jgi:hypothetical protein